MASVQERVSPPYRRDVPKPTGDRRGGVLASASIIGAILASSCCVVPLVLVVLGIGGAWVGSLTALEPYKPYVIAVTAGLIGSGFWHVYFKRKADCVAGSYCENPVSGRITKLALWIATAVVLLAATVNSWAPWFY